MAPTAQLHVGRALALIAAIGLGLLGWNWPVLLPFKLLAVMGHETGHALASLVVGGSIERVVIAADQSGVCLSRVPPGVLASIVVSSMGYVGSALIASLLIFCTYRLGLRRPMLVLTATWLATMGVLLAGDLFTTSFCLGMAALFAALAKWLPALGVAFVNSFVAAFTALYALIDLKDDLWSAATRAHTDAQILASATHVPSVLWAALWSVCSVGVLALALRSVLFARPERTAQGLTVASVRPARAPASR